MPEFDALFEVMAKISRVSKDTASFRRQLKTGSEEDTGFAVFIVDNSKPSARKAHSIFNTIAKIAKATQY